MNEKENLRGKPWNLREPEVPNEIYLPKGMLGAEERRALWWIARHGVTGKGAVVDAGAFLGASAFCMASGVAGRAPAKPNEPIIHSYDFFSAFDDYVAEVITEQFRPTQAGQNYQDIFEYQTGKYHEYISIHPGDFCSYEWTFGPIDLLFIDVAKTQELNSHLLRQMFPSLVPGISVVVQQDFYHCWHPYIHITMQLLNSYFDIVDPLVINQSRVYRLKRPIPAGLLETIAAYRFTAAEKIEILNEFVSAEHGEMRYMAKVVRLYQLFLNEDYDSFERESLLLSTDAELEPDSLWAVQLREIDALFSRRRDGRATSPQDS